MRKLRTLAGIWALAAIVVLTACSPFDTPQATAQTPDPTLDPMTAQTPDQISAPPSELSTPPPNMHEPLDWNNADALIDAVMASGAFSETLFELPDEAMGFDYYSLDAADYQTARFYFSPGSTAEELVYLQANDEAAFNAAKDAAKKRMEAQIPSAADYFPAEVPKLEHAHILTDEQKLVVLVCVANDYDAFEKAVK